MRVKGLIQSLKYRGSSKVRESRMRQQQYSEVIWKDFFAVVERHEVTDSQKPVNPKNNIYSKTMLKYTKIAESQR